MSLIDVLIGKIAPHDCLGCGAEGALLCSACAQLLPSAAEVCYRCQQASPNYLTCQACIKFGGPNSARAAFSYDGVARSIVQKLKFSGAQTTSKTMAKLMARSLSKGVVLVPIPTATSRVRQRGFDHAKLLARKLANEAGLAYADCLARSGQAHQVGSGRQQRLDQLNAAFRVNKTWLVAGRSVILVDDVITTGATLESACQALRQTGITRIEAVAFARTAK